MQLTTTQQDTKKAIIDHLIATKESSIANLREAQAKDQAESREEIENEENLFETGKTDQAYNRVEARARVLDALVEELAVLKGLETIEPNEQIQMGDVIETDRGKFFVAVPADEFTVGGETYRGISAKSPLFRALMGKRNGESVSVNDVEYTLKASY